MLVLQQKQYVFWEVLNHKPKAPLYWTIVSFAYWYNYLQVLGYQNKVDV